MTASPMVNGQERPAAPQVLGDWQPVAATPTPETVAEEAPQPAPESELVAQAKAEAIRAQAWAESEKQRIAAEAEKEAAIRRADAEADAIRTRAEEEARKQRLANDRAERKAAEEQAASEARVADHQRRREEADRVRREAARQAEEQTRTERADAEKIADAEGTWKFFAVAFAAVCGVVALPVQMAAFWTEKAPWMISAPFMLEGAAWVVLRGAAAAVAAHRPHWHFRLIAWALAFVAAGVNLWHGLAEFDPATAIGTAVASIAGPGVWDLHEHGRIRKRDGVPTRRERKAAEKAAKAETKRKAEEEAQRAADKEAADKAAEEARQELAKTRETEFPNVWKHALRLAAALGETTVTESVWRRAHLDIEGTDPGESAETIRARNVAAARVESARTGTPVNTLSKTTNAQRAAQMPSGPNRVLKARATRRPGDTPKYVGAARNQAAITARNAANNSRPTAD
ncbi:hypothetical protein ACWD25_17535 [Streptomyces sp. NPDC002920]